MNRLEREQAADLLDQDQALYVGRPLARTAGNKLIKPQLRPDIIYLEKGQLRQIVGYLTQSRNLLNHYAAYERSSKKTGKTRLFREKLR